MLDGKGFVSKPSPPLRNMMDDEKICQQQSALCQCEKEILACPADTIPSVICKWTFPHTEESNKFPHTEMKISK